MSHATHILKKARPVRTPMKTGMASLDRFDRATVEEAKKVILGTSAWFAFDENGSLEVLSRYDSPESAKNRQQLKELMQEALDDPASYLCKIDALKNASPETNEKVERLQSELAGFGADEPETGPLKRQLSKALKTMQWIHESQIEEMQQALRYSEIFANFDAHYNTYENNIREMLAIPKYLPKPEVKPDDAGFIKWGDVERAHKTWPGARREQLKEQAEKSVEGLRHATMLFPATIGAKKRDAVDALASKANLRIHENDGYVSDSFTPDRWMILSAAMTLLAQQLPGSHENVRHTFNELVHVTASSHNVPEMQALLDDGIDMDAMRRHENMEQHMYELTGDDERHLGALNDALQHYRRISRGDMTGMPTKDEQRYMDWTWHDDEYWEPMGAFRQSHKQALTIIDFASTDYWRYHNLYPDAVNFVRAAEGSDYLLKWDGSTKRIDDAASFLGSDWARMAGKVDLKVAPRLIEQVRTDLLGTAIAHA